MTSDVAQVPCDHDFSSAGAAVLLVLGFGQNVERMRWSVISRVWHVTVSESPDLFRELQLDMVRTQEAAERLVRVSGARLVRLECRFATDELLRTCSEVAPSLRHLMVAPCPDLTALPTTWSLETLDVRGSISVFDALPAMCNSLRELKVGWWKEQDPDGRETSLQEWLLQWRDWLFQHNSQVPFNVRDVSGAADLVGNLASEASCLRVLHLHGHVFPANFDALADLMDLEAIHLPYANISAPTVSRLAKLPRVKALNLRACRVDVPDVQNLEFLNASCTHIKSSSLARLGAHCPQLRVLDLCYAPMLDRTVLPSLAEFHHPLEMLGLGGFNLTDADLELIVRTWCGLKNLGIGCAKAGSQGLRALCSLPQLKRLCAHQLQSLEEVVVWELLQHMEQVDLSDCQWVKEPSAEVMAAIESRPYDFDYY